jgi:hypothetical protein
MKAEYTLAQAVAMVNLATAAQWNHRRSCEMCRAAEVCGNVLEDYCEEGQQIESLRRKWKRRCKYAAKREGVQMTV